MEKRKPTSPEPQASRTWERLEEFVRVHVQRFIQALLEERGHGVIGADEVSPAGGR
jgi:hypothetical protein